jgi:hypothetical protein
MNRGLKSIKKVDAFISIIVLLSFICLLISIVTDLFSGRLELLFCCIVVVGSYLLYLNRRNANERCRIS